MEKIENAKLELGMYDSDTHDSVLAIHMADASALCPESARCIIKYANVKRGLIAQICNWYTSDEDLGSTVHYFVEEETPITLARDEVFERQAIMMGAVPLTLSQFIYDSTPTHP